MSRPYMSGNVTEGGGKRSKHKKRSAWVKPWPQKRTQFGIYDTLLQKLRLQEEEDYKKFLRMSTDTFDE